MTIDSWWVRKFTKNICSSRCIWWRRWWPTLSTTRRQWMGRRWEQRQRLPLSGLPTDQLPHLPGHSRQFRQLQGIPGSGQRRRRRRRQTDQRNDWHNLFIPYRICIEVIGPNIDVLARRWAVRSAKWFWRNDGDATRSAAPSAGRRSTGSPPPHPVRLVAAYTL